MPWRALRPLDRAGRVEVLNEPCQEAGVHMSNRRCTDGIVVCGAMKYIQSCYTHAFRRCAGGSPDLTGTEVLPARRILEGGDRNNEDRIRFGRLAKTDVPPPITTNATAPRA